MRTLLEIHHNGLPPLKSEEEAHDFLLNLGRMILQAMARSENSEINYVFMNAADYEDVIASYHRPTEILQIWEDLRDLTRKLEGGNPFVFGMVKHSDGKYGLHS